MPTKEEMMNRLREELRRTPEVELITQDEYTTLKEIAAFKCPNGWHVAGCDGHNCPRQPNPCDKCTITKLLDRARERHGVIPDNIFRKHMKRCDSCDEKTRWMEEPTYYERCGEARRAKHVIQQVVEGKTAVVNNGNGWTIPV